MKSVLSTKILLPNQKELLLNSGLHFVEYNAIQIKKMPFDSPKHIPFGLVSSKNAVEAILEHGIEVETYYCVGEKTKDLLEKNDQKVAIFGKNARELSDFIEKNHKNELIHFFCGSRRREELPSHLKAAGIPFKEIITYSTECSPKKFDRGFDAVLFFSPSGVESHLSENKLESTWAICIGETTMEAIPPNHKKIAVANTPTVESVIAKTVKTLLQHD